MTRSPDATALQPKIKPNRHMSQQTIETIQGSILSTAEIPRRTKARQPVKTFFDVIQHVETCLTKNSHLENQRCTLMIGEEFNIKVSNETSHKTCGLLQNKH
jgi:hypothetical protein